MKVLIIEDEKLTARDLAQTIMALEPDCEILPFIHSVEDGISYLGQGPDINLIFSDIELGDGLSFEIFSKVNTVAPVIFCTAYQEYMLDAFRHFGIDYILKPFNKQSVGRTLTKYKALEDRFSSKEDATKLLDLLRAGVRTAVNAPSVLVYQGDKIIPLSGDDVALFFVEDESNYALTFDGRRMLINTRMDSLEKTFSNTFFRANRQHLVNRKAVKDAAQSFNRKIQINLTVPFEGQILVGKLKLTEFLRWLSGA